MHRRADPGPVAVVLQAALLAATPLPWSSAQALELTGRVSVLGTAAWPAADDAGGSDADIDTPTADQQGVRLMFDDHGSDAEWSVHIRATRQRLRGFAAADRHSSDLFRYRALSGERVTGDARRRSTRLEVEIDRAHYERRFGAASVSVGRQPIDWGSGRFWQPFNVFGAFAPTDLDTDFKPGIDAAVGHWYPSAFSSVTGVFAFAPRGDPASHNSVAMHYRRQVADSAEMALLAGRVVGNDVLGASVGGDWRGVGWRIEGLHSTLDRTGEDALFWIAGLDYQFDEGTLLSLEWHDNGRGAASETGLAVMRTDALVTHGLQQQLSRRLLGLSLQRDLSPLLSAHYTLLASALRDTAGHRAASLVHQVNFVYSLGDESDLLLSFAYGSGKGLDSAGEPRSEFGAQPASVTLRWRLYF